MIVHFFRCWFLIFSLFLPRMCTGSGVVRSRPGALSSGTGWIPPLLALLGPRILILFLIYRPGFISSGF